MPPTPDHHPLSGIRVVDLSQVVSGPICGRLLADLGAEVVKVEPPAGDITRTVPPHVDGTSVFFAQMNAGKRNVCIDLKAPGGPELLRRLVARADVVVENFRPGVLARHGLDPSTLRAADPRLVVCSVSGWGQDGPWAQRRAYAPLVQAEAGTIDMTARLRGAPPAQEVHVHGDVYPGLLAASAVLTALYQRERTGRGQHVDVSMAQALVYADEWAAVELQRYEGERAFDTWTHPVLRLGDGSWVALVGNPVRVFEAWVRALRGDPAVLADPRFADPVARAAHGDACVEVLAELVARFADQPAIEAALEGWPMFVAPVRSVADLAATPWAAHRGLVAEVAPGLPVPAAPWRGEPGAVGVSGPPARRGEHNHAVLAELGLDTGAVARLERSGALVPPPDAAAAGQDARPGTPPAG